MLLELDGLATISDVNLFLYEASYRVSCGNLYCVDVTFDKGAMLMS